MECSLRPHVFKLHWYLCRLIATPENNEREIATQGKTFRDKRGERIKDINFNALSWILKVASSFKGLINAV